MSIYSRVHRYKMFRNLVVSYILIVLITIALLSSTLTYLFSRSATRTIAVNLQSILTQESYSSDVLNDQLMALNDQIIMDPDVLDYMNVLGSDKSKVSTYHVLLKLKSYKANYPFIESISLYNLRDGTCLDTNDISVDGDIVRAHSKKYMYFYARVSSEIKSSGTDENQDLLTFIFTSNSQLVNMTKFAVIINVNPDYILSTVRGIDKGINSSSIFVMDSNGRVVSDENSGYFLKDLSSVGYIRKVFSSGAESGFFIGTWNGVKQIVTHVKSKELGLYFVSVQPYDTITADLTRLRGIALLISLLLFIIGLLISLFMSRYLYTPLKRLMEKINKNEDYGTKGVLDECAMLSRSFDKYQELRESAESLMYNSSRKLKQNSLLTLVKGIHQTFLPPNKAVDDAGLRGKCFRVVLLKIDEYKKLQNASGTKDLAAFRYALCNIAEEIFRTSFICDAVITEEDEIALLLQAESDRGGEIAPLLSKIRQSVMQYFTISLSAAIGTSVSSHEQIHDSYEMAVSFIKYRLFYGPGCIVNADMVEAHTKNTVRFQYETERMIIKLLYSGNLDGLSAEVENFVEAVRQAPYYQMIAYCNQLVIAVYKQFEDMEIFKNEQVDALLRLNNCTSLHEIGDTLKDFCVNVGAMLKEKSDLANDEKYQEIIEKVRQFIQEEYHNQNVSLEMVAEMVGLSPGYLGKLFKLRANISFNDYLNSVRMDKAKELLVGTSEPIARIGEMVGIYSTTYFSTLFKKMMLMTPSQYRERNMRG